MATAESYAQEAQRLIYRLFPEGKVALSWSSASEALAHKRSIMQLQKELRLIKKRIAVDKRQIGSQFTTQRLMIGKGFGAGVAAGLFGRRNMGSVNAARRNDLRVQQLQAQAPYEEASAKIDAVLAQLDGLKNDIDGQLLAGA